MITSHHNPATTTSATGSERKSLLTTAALQLLIEALFPVKKQNELVLQMARQFIAGFIGRNGDHYANYAVFCQRILMARYYFIQTAALPKGFTLLQWLDPDNAHGFAGTERWYAQLQDRRSVKPLHLIELKAIPEAMMEMVEEGSLEIYEYWFNWFEEQGNPDMLQVWKNVAGSLFFNGHCLMLLKGF